jgi:hypothetical protein
MFLIKICRKKDLKEGEEENFRSLLGRIEEDEGKKF